MQTPAGGDLSKVYAKRQGRALGNGQILRVFTQVARAVEFLHKQSPPIIHRDIKAGAMQCRAAVTCGRAKTTLSTPKAT